MDKPQAHPSLAARGVEGTLLKTRLVVYVSLFLAMAGFGITIPILPFMARDLGASAVQVSLLVSLFAMAQFVSGPVWGSLSDRLGRKGVLVAGLFGYSLSFAFAGLAWTLPLLIASRALGGLLSASIFPASQALIADLTEPEERGPAMAAMGAWINLGFLFGPVIGGALSPLGYHAPMLIAGALVAVTAALAWVCLVEPVRAENGEGPGIAAGRRRAEPAAWPRLSDFGTAAASPISPYLWLTFAIAFSVAGFVALLGYYVIDRLGGTAVDAGTIFTAIGLTGFLVQGLLVGRLIRRFGEHRLSVAGAFLSVAGLVALVPAATLPQAVAGAMVVSLGSSVLRPAVTSAVSRLTPLRQGITMGIQSSLDSLGRMTGPILSGWAYGLSLTLPFWLAGAVMVAFGTSAALAARRPSPPAGPSPAGTRRHGSRPRKGRDPKRPFLTQVGLRVRPFPSTRPGRDGTRSP